MINDKVQMRVSTDAVIHIAAQVNYFNLKLAESFEKLEKDIRVLGNLWEGKAAQNNMAAFEELKKSWSDIRKEKIEDLVDYLAEIVGPGFELTENENKGLSEQFK